MTGVSRRALKPMSLRSAACLRALNEHDLAGRLLKVYEHDGLQPQDVSLVAARVLTTALMECDLHAFPVSSRSVVRGVDAFAELLRQSESFPQAGDVARREALELEQRHFDTGMSVSQRPHYIVIVGGRLLVDPAPLWRTAELAPLRLDGLSPGVVVLEVDDNASRVQAAIACEGVANDHGEPFIGNSFHISYDFHHDRDFLKSDLWVDRDRLRPRINDLRYAMEQTLVSKANEAVAG